MRSHQGCQVQFRTSRRNVGILWRCCSGQGPHIAMTRETRGFFELRRDSRVTTGNSGFLSISDSDRRVPAGLGQESQASSCLSNGTLLASRVVQWVSGPSSSCVWNPRVFADDARGWQCPFVLCLHPQGCLRREVRSSGPSQERTGESGAFGLWPHPRGSSRISS